MAVTEAFLWLKSQDYTHVCMLKSQDYSHVCVLKSHDYIHVCVLKSQDESFSSSSSRCYRCRRCCSFLFLILLLPHTSSFGLFIPPWEQPTHAKLSYLLLLLAVPYLSSPCHLSVYNSFSREFLGFSVSLWVSEKGLSSCAIVRFSLCAPYPAPSPPYPAPSPPYPVPCPPYPAPCPYLFASLMSPGNILENSSVLSLLIVIQLVFSSSSHVPCKLVWV